MASPPVVVGRRAVEMLMERHGIPVTRENYLERTYLGEPPKHLGEPEGGRPPCGP